MHDYASGPLEKFESQPHFLAVACPYRFHKTECKISDLVRVGPASAAVEQFLDRRCRHRREQVEGRTPFTASEALGLTWWSFESGGFSFIRARSRSSQAPFTVGFLHLPRSSRTHADHDQRHMVIPPRESIKRLS
jgi:hypothetical protein